MPADDRNESSSARKPAHATTVPSGTRIVGGTYEVERLLKAGGMGEVYRGRNVFNGLPVAIKIVLGSQSADETHTKLFEREALVLSKLAHEAIVRYHVYTVDPIIGRPCLVMEFVPGPSLMERMTEGPMPVEDVRIVMRRVASGLGAAHKLGVIHRDLSPDNVILEDGLVDHAKLIDFGIAKAGSISAGTMLEGRVAGKYNYMAPEQLGLANGVVDARADIYALGLVVVGMFRGKALNMGENPFEAITRRQAVPDLSEVPPEMQPILARMLAPNPDERPDTMLTLIKMLDQPGFMPPLPQARPDNDATVLGGPLPVQPPAEPYVSYVDPTTPPAPLRPPPDSTVVSSVRPKSVVEDDAADRTVVSPRRPSPAGNSQLEDSTVITGVSTGLDAAEAPKRNAKPAALPEGFGKATASAAASAKAAQAAAPAPARAKGKGTPLALAGVAVAAAIGGGTFFMLQGGQAPAPAVEPVAAPATQAAVPATKPAITEPAQPAVVAPALPDVPSQITWLSAAAKGQCLHFEQSAAGSGAALQWRALTAAPGNVATLANQFTTALKATPKFEVVTVARSQCAALEFATIRGTPSDKGPAIALEAKDGILKDGKALRGTVTGTAGQATAVFLIGSTGAVAQLGPYVTNDPKSDAHFDVPLTLAPGSKPTEQLLLTVTTKTPVPDFATLGDGYTADTAMPRLALWLEQSHQTAEINLTPFRLEP